MKDKKRDEELEELKNKYLRALADYQNLEKQTQVWREDFVKFANQDLITDLLEVLGDLEKAQSYLNDNGLQIVLDKLAKILKNSGVEEIKVEGCDFDPMEMECVGMEEGKTEGKVLKVTQKGYKLNKKLIRTAKVIVSKKILESPNGSPE